LVSYFDALRDRLIFFFEIRGLTKKPKLVAVTSCGDKSGVSTIAAGLAAALSKTGEGNVLLVDMNMEQHAPYHFRNGTIRVGLDELLDGQRRDDAMVQNNLYAVPHATGRERLARILPKRFTDMIPRLRASDYDFVIFDMPAVNQVSVTPQLARFMDMVFLMVESEKTNREAVKRASSLLTQASCTLGIIVNRTRNYLPRALLQEV
jgi:Mrp family chromosome partitioning ATPase